MASSDGKSAIDAHVAHLRLAHRRRITCTLFTRLSLMLSVENLAISAPFPLASAKKGHLAAMCGTVPAVESDYVHTTVQIFSGLFG
jgi:hypothetical protein